MGHYFLDIQKEFCSVRLKCLFSYAFDIVKANSLALKVFRERLQRYLWLILTMLLDEYYFLVKCRSIKDKICIYNKKRGFNVL